MQRRATTYRVAFSLLLLSLSAAGALTSQTQFRIPFYVSDNTVKRDTLIFGVHPQASYCIDDPTLKFGNCDTIEEAELPPTPPSGVFDVRFIDTRSGPGACLGVGMGENITSFTGASDVDTFQIKFQPGAGGYPFKFRWPQGLSAFADSIRLRDPLGLPAQFGGVSVNMLTVDSATVTNSLINALYIFVYHPKAQTYPGVPALTAPLNNAVGVDTNATLSRTLPRKVGDYLRDFYFDTVCLDPDYLRFATEIVPVENLLLGSDAPFPLGEPDPVNFVRRALPAEQANLVLQANYRRLTGT